MTNDKATRQAIYGALLRHVDKFVQCSDIQKAIDEVISSLSELQPEPSKDRGETERLRQQEVMDILESYSTKDNNTEHLVLHQIQFESVGLVIARTEPARLRPVNKTDEQAAKEYAENAYYMCKSLARGKDLFLAGCQKVRTEIASILPRREADKDLLESELVKTVIAFANWYDKNSCSEASQNDPWMNETNAKSFLAEYRKNK